MSPAVTWVPQHHLRVALEGKATTALVGSSASEAAGLRGDQVRSVLLATLIFLLGLMVVALHVTPLG